MERFELEFFSSVINVWLFEEVKNANEIKKADITLQLFCRQIQITSRQHLITAVSQALVTRSHGTLKTKTLHSEILWTLSPGTNIMEAIKKFGLGPQTSALLLVKLQPIQAEPDSLSNEGLDQAARALVDGNLVSLDHLGKSIVNWKELRRMYKINDDLVIKELERKSKTTAGDLELHAMIDKIVTSTVALKSVAA
ncbi:hypothetical protein PSTT_09561 [Puccinia striiformis]|uniref:EKC/KEOPS complex subunit CGI121 n=1 Tax=Puccinia striiformis TaxID=27350 RepID=A0A2S4V7V5_9BASI|nr:hypothetical protein PSTT_09561 [Puccinia striiformis]